MVKSVVTVQVANEQSQLVIDTERIERAVRAVLEGEEIDRAEVSVAVVDDATIRQLNRRHLDHDYATDVLSFLLERDEERLEGEVVVSAETARSSAAEFGWSEADELLLYVVHGTLHLAGYEDETEDQRAEMRNLERTYLAPFGLEPRYTTNFKDR